MSKDLIRRTDLTKSEQRELEDTKRTEVERAQEALAERMLFGAATRPQEAGPPSMLLGLDLSTSLGEFVEPRDIGPEAAEAMASGVYKGAGPAGLRAKLIYFRGDNGNPKQPRQLRVSNEWYTPAEELARAILLLKPWGGWTQHTALLRQAVAEAEKQAIQRLVILTDAFEGRTPLRPDGDDPTAALVHVARLRDLGVKVDVGYKGTIRGACPLDRAGIDAEQVFQNLAQAGGGRCFLCNPTGHPERLRERFREIGELARLNGQGDTSGEQKLLEHLQTIQWDLTVADRVPSARCASKSRGSEE